MCNAPSSTDAWILQLHVPLLCVTLILQGPRTGWKPGEIPTTFVFWTLAIRDLPNTILPKNPPPEPFLSHSLPRCLAASLNPKPNLHSARRRSHILKTKLYRCQIEIALQLCCAGTALWIRDSGKAEPLAPPRRRIASLVSTGALGRVVERYGSAKYIFEARRILRLPEALRPELKVVVSAAFAQSSRWFWCNIEPRRSRVTRHVVHVFVG